MKQLRGQNNHIENQVQTMVEEGPWHRAWKMLERRQTIRPASNIKMDDVTYTTTENEANEYFIWKYYPEDDPAKETEQMREIRQERMRYTITNEPDITAADIEDVIGRLKKRRKWPSKKFGRR